MNARCVERVFHRWLRLRPGSRRARQCGGRGGRSSIRENICTVRCGRPVQVTVMSTWPNSRRGHGTELVGRNDFWGGDRPRSRHRWRGLRAPGNAHNWASISGPGRRLDSGDNRPSIRETPRRHRRCWRLRGRPKALSHRPPPRSRGWSRTGRRRSRLRRSTFRLLVVGARSGHDGYLDRSTESLHTF